MSEKLVCTKGLSRETWLEWRRKGIGGSDAAAIMGLDPYSSPLTVWADKTGILPEKQTTEAMRQGLDLEAYVASRWEEATGKKVRRINYMVRHDDYPFITANIDRDVVGENAGLECKTTGVYNARDFESGKIPPQFTCQCTHYMAVMGYDRMYLAVLVLNAGFYSFVIERREEEIRDLLAAETDFWNKYIVTGIPPSADGSEASREVLELLYPAGAAGTPPVSLTGCEHKLARIYTLQNEIRSKQAQIDKYRQALIQRLGTATEGRTGQYKVTWKPQVTHRLDARAVRVHYPAVFEECSTAAKTRVFRIAKLNGE